MISHPTQHIAAVPMAVRNVNTLGIGKTMFRPILRRSALPACEVQSDVIHLHKKGYDPINQNRDKDADGRPFPVRRTLSLVNDIFPNLQMGSEVPGEWTHVNSGLFRPQIFATLGGFSDCIEEDREFRNRIILSGEIVWIIPDLLLTKYETEGALTQDSRTDYNSGRRRADRLRVWRQIETWLSDRSVAPCPVDLPPRLIASATNPGGLALSDALATPPTRAWIAAFLKAGSEADHG